MNHAFASKRTEMGFALEVADRVFCRRGIIVEEAAPANFFDTPAHEGRGPFLGRVLLDIPRWHEDGRLAERCVRSDDAIKLRAHTSTPPSRRIASINFGEAIVRASGLPRAGHIALV